MCPVVSVRKLVLDDPADFTLKLSGLVDAQAGVDVLASGQLEVVHFSAPLFGVVLDGGTMPCWW